MRIQLVGLLSFVGMVACVSEDLPENETPTRGVLQLGLTSVSQDGDRFRLRSATFDISGCADIGGYAGFPGMGELPPCTNSSVSSEDDLDAESITRTVLPGYYSVTLRTGWYLEELEGQAWNRVEQALLLSASTQSTYVWDRGVSPVGFAFGVDGELIDFRHGDLAITISVERPGDNNVAGFGGFMPTPAGAVAAGTGAPVPVAGAAGAAELPVAGAAGSN